LGRSFVTLPPEIKTTSYSTNSIWIGSADSGMSTATNLDTVSLSNQVYVKYTFGFDKTFGKLVLEFSIQPWIFNERGNSGPERLQDYLLLRLEKKFLSDKLKVYLTGMLNVNNFADMLSTNAMGSYFNDNSGTMGQAGIAFLL